MILHNYRLHKGAETLRCLVSNDAYRILMVILPIIALSEGVQCREKSEDTGKALQTILQATGSYVFNAVTRTASYTVYSLLSYGYLVKAMFLSGNVQTRLTLLRVFFIKLLYDVIFFSLYPAIYNIFTTGRWIYGLISLGASLISSIYIKPYLADITKSNSFNSEENGKEINEALKCIYRTIQPNVNLFVTSRRNKDESRQNKE